MSSERSRISAEYSREIFLDVDRESAFALIESSALLVGGIVNSSKGTGLGITHDPPWTIKIKTRYGMDGLDLHVAAYLMPHEQGTSVTIEGPCPSSHDSFSVTGARMAIDELLKVIRQFHSQ